ncbi:glutamate/tyrosine decarboxylase-like PLP-dependent enzyme [Streptomyces sp. SAI-170]
MFSAVGGLSREVEARQIPMEGDRFHIDPQAATELCDENTIGVVGILGSTYDGSYEPSAKLCAALDSLQERTGLDIPVHVDGASGAMVAPFLDPNMPTFALNFSRPGAQVVAQYCTFLRLGRHGHREVQQAARDVAGQLPDGIEALGDFWLLTRGTQLPAPTFTTARTFGRTTCSTSPGVCVSTAGWSPRTPFRHIGRTSPCGESCAATNSRQTWRIC